MLPKFEVLFGIPGDHDLVLTRSRGRGGAMRGEFWSHQEVDQSGAVIACYESHDEVDANGHARRGWRKYDSLGSLVDAQTVSASWSVASKRQLPFAA